MLRKAIATVFLATCLVGTTSFADTLVIDGIDTMDRSEFPARGLTKESVRSAWGDPRDQVAPVGDPPISSWDYDSFTVYFEYDKVVHVVSKR